MSAGHPPWSSPIKGAPTLYPGPSITPSCENSWTICSLSNIPRAASDKLLVNCSWALLLVSLACAALIGICLTLRAANKVAIKRLVGQLGRVNGRLNRELQWRVQLEEEVAASREQVLEASR